MGERGGAVSLQYLLDRILRYFPNANVEMVERAYHFSQRPPGAVSGV